MLSEPTPSEKSASSKVEYAPAIIARCSLMVLSAIAKALDSKIYCDNRKAAILRCQSDPELHDMLTSDPLDAIVHLVPLSVIASDKLKVYLERWKGSFSKILGFRPTGWT